MITNDNFIRGLIKNNNDDSGYPFSIPAVIDIEKIKFDKPVTFLVGENGSGKSTIIEAVAALAGFNREGGSKNSLFSTSNTSSNLCEFMQLIRGSRRERDGFFLRAESFYNVATYNELIGVEYGDKSLHQQSHGESFLHLVNNNFYGNGLFLLDEPESALSPQRQLSLMVAINKLVNQNSQFIIVTHSPILLSLPNSTIYELNNKGLSVVNYNDIDHVKLTRDFLNNPDLFLKSLLD